MEASMWSVPLAKAKLSEILRRARAGEPQVIGAHDPCVVISADEYRRLKEPKHLGRFLVETAPRAGELEAPSRASQRKTPFSDAAS
jgi:prevent-host-death family protein